MLGRQIGLSKKATQTALRKLNELGIIHIKTRAELNLQQEAEVNYGPNARFVRILFEKVVSYVEERMEKPRPRRRRKLK